jgi:hypothetical protein
VMYGSTAWIFDLDFANLGFRVLYCLAEMKQLVIPDTKWFIRHPIGDIDFSRGHATLFHFRDRP